MGREVRMVPPDWQPPTYFGKDWRTNMPDLRFRSLLAGGFDAALGDWKENKAAWDRGEVRDWTTGGWKPKVGDEGTFEEWHGGEPKRENYMPDFAPGTATHLMMFETTSEGSPISPAFATPEELARWLADNNASAFAGEGATYEEWLRVCQGGYAPSAIISDGVIQSGVAGLTP